jgi:hypothetical protein
VFAAVAAILLAHPPGNPVQSLLTHTPDDTKTTRAAVHVALSPDGKWLAACEVTRDDQAQEWIKQLRLWDVKAGMVVETRTGATGGDTE